MPVSLLQHLIHSGLYTCGICVIEYQTLNAGLLNGSAVTRVTNAGKNPITTLMQPSGYAFTNTTRTTGDQYASLCCIISVSQNYLVRIMSFRKPGYRTANIGLVKPCNFRDSINASFYRMFILRLSTCRGMLD